MAQILVVDDDADVLATLAAIVRNGGHEVFEAGSGAAALEVLDQPHGFDLLLTDVAMPELNGFNLARIARMRRPALRILFISGFSEQALALRDPLDAYGRLLLKPMMPDELRREIDDTLAVPAISAAATPT